MPALLLHWPACQPVQHGRQLARQPVRVALDAQTGTRLMGTCRWTVLAAPLCACCRSMRRFSRCYICTQLALAIRAKSSCARLLGQPFARERTAASGMKESTADHWQCSVLCSVWVLQGSRELPAGMLLIQGSAPHNDLWGVQQWGVQQGCRASALCSRCLLWVEPLATMSRAAPE